MEFTLPVALIAGVALVAVFQWVGPTFQDTLPAVFQGARSTDAKAVLQPREMGKNPFFQQYSYRLPDGSLISMPDFPGNVPGLIEVVGADGTTDRLSAALEELATRLLAEKKIDEAQANLIKLLSNKGFRFGDTQALFDQAAQRCGTDKNCFRQAVSMILTQDRQSGSNYLLNSAHQESAEYIELNQMAKMTPEQLQIFEALSPQYFKEIKQDVNYFKNDPSGIVAGKDLLAFMDVYRSIQTDSKIDSGTKNVIQFLTSNIFNIQVLSLNSIQFATENYSWDQRNGFVDSSQGAFQDKKPSHFRELIAQRMKNEQPSLTTLLTDANSQAICTTGNGQTENRRCR